MNKKRLCPTCQSNYMVRWDAKQCNSCNRKSDEFINRMRDQSKRANKRANEVRWGEKQTNDWHYDLMSPELAYLIGSYLTDGWINIKRHTLGLDVTNESFAKYFTECLKKLGLEPANGIRIKHAKTHKGKKPIHRTRVYSRTLCAWLKEQCDEKNKIPMSIVQSSQECQIAFLAGAIDGDGMVANEGGHIAVYGCAGWMGELPLLLKQIGIRTGGYRFIKTLPSGKRFHAVSIHRQDFIDRNGFCAVDYKQANILIKPPKKDRTKRDFCPQCGKQKRFKSLLCHHCSVTSSEHKEHMRNIASKGANARWGHE